MTRVALLACATSILLVSACGDAADPTSDPAKALSFMPAEPALVAIADTDVEGDQVKSFERTLGKSVDLGDVEKTLIQVSSDIGLDYEADVEPLLGAPLVVGLVEEEGSTPPGENFDVLGALEVPDEDKLRDTLEKVPEAEAVTEIEDGVLLFGSSAEMLDEAVERHESESGLDAQVVEQGLRDTPDEALVKLYSDLDDTVMKHADFAPLTKMPWFAALTTFGGGISFEGIAMRAQALLTTDHVEAGDLPLAPTGSAPDVVLRDGWVSGGNIDQSRTTAFLLRAVRAAFPDSDFVSDVATVERERGIDFEREFLRQFNGPSQSLLHPDGRFAARSAVRDPKRLAITMRKIAPDLGRLVEDLQALQSTGLAMLLLLAPDAPAATSVLDSADVRVEPLSGGLYRMTGLEGPGPDQIVFGLVDDVFVVAEDEQAAGEIAHLPAEPFDGPAGAAVAHANADAIDPAARNFLGLGVLGLVSANGSLSAAPDGLRGKLEAEFED